MELKISYIIFFVYDNGNLHYSEKSYRYRREEMIEAG